jgi:Trehalose utilisation
MPDTYQTAGIRWGPPPQLLPSPGQPLSQDPQRIQNASLRGYRVVVFLSTTGEPLDPTQQAALKGWAEVGGGWVAVHAAADAFHDWPWYGELSAHGSDAT